MLIEHLYNHHREELQRFARAMARNDKEAEDLLHETFLRAMSNAVTLGRLAEYKQRAWLYTVLRNILYDLRRRERFEVAWETEHEPVDDVDLDSGLVKEELLQHLPPKYRDLVFKRFFMGMTSKQIADLLGIPHATARSRLYTAMNLLRSKLQLNKEDFK